MTTALTPCRGGRKPARMRLATAAMATRFELVLHGEDPMALRAGGESAIERIEEAHRLFTRFEPTSLIAHLRRLAPAWVAVDRDTVELFLDAIAVAGASVGAFDPTGCGDWPAIGIDAAGQRLSLPRSTVELDLGAIAKGHAIDLAIDALREAGVESAFVHGGTSSGFGLGRPPGMDAWRVGWTGGAEVFELVDQAYAVSATLRDRGGAIEAHVVDPRTGVSIDHPRQVIVIGPTARLADAWATAALVTGERPASLGDEWTVVTR